jgi:ribonuclease-3
LAIDPQVRLAAEAAVGHTFSDERLLEQALTHASLADARSRSNERLEFLGDAVLGMVVCEHLHERYPELLEGELTKVKSLLVSRRMCAEYAISAGLLPLLAVGKGMSIGAGSLPPSVAAAVFEAMVAAVHIDGGIGAASSFIMRHVGPHVEAAARHGHQMNFKSVLQQVLQQGGKGSPAYAVMDEKGPDHAKCFEVCVEMGVHRFPTCWGSTKKAAEQGAALAALRELGVVTGDGDSIVVHWDRAPEAYDAIAARAIDAATSASGRSPSTSRSPSDS